MDIERELAELDFSPLSGVKDVLWQRIAARDRSGWQSIGEELDDDALDQVVAAGQGGLKPPEMPRKKN